MTLLAINLLIFVVRRLCLCIHESVEIQMWIRVMLYIKIVASSHVNRQWFRRDAQDECIVCTINNPIGTLLKAPNGTCEGLKCHVFIILSRLCRCTLNDVLYALYNARSKILTTCLEGLNRTCSAKVSIYLSIFRASCRELSEGDRHVDVILV